MSARITFSTDIHLAPLLTTMRDWYVRIVISDSSPERPGERVHCIIGDLMVPWSPTMWVTEVDPTTEDLEPIGVPFQIIPERIHVL